MVLAFVEARRRRRGSLVWSLPRVGETCVGWSRGGGREGGRGEQVVIKTSIHPPPRGGSAIVFDMLSTCDTEICGLTGRVNVASTASLSACVRWMMMLLLGWWMGNKGQRSRTARHDSRCIGGNCVVSPGDVVVVLVSSSSVGVRRVGLQPCSLACAV